LILPDVGFDLEGEMHRKQNKTKTKKTTKKKQASKQKTNKQKQSNENFENLWTQGPITVNCRL